MIPIMRQTEWSISSASQPEWFGAGTVPCPGRTRRERELLADLANPAADEIAATIAERQALLGDLPGDLKCQWATTTA